MRGPHILFCLLPVVLLVALLALNVLVFGDDALSGANQLILMFAAAVAGAIAMLNGNTWEELQTGIVRSISISTPALLILLMVGALSGTWLLSGVVPTMIYYGLFILSPSIFLVAACLISIIVSLSTGSSWTTSATVGIALMGIGITLEFNPAMVAGAILSGAYFGDKLSPLSDTTNLAAGIAETDLFTHIRYMLFTTIPSILIALVVFGILGLGANDKAVDTHDIQAALASTFNISFVLLLAPVSVVAMIIKKVPALPALFIGALIGALLAVIMQGHLIHTMAAAQGYENFGDYAVLLTAFFGKTSIVTGTKELDDLLSSGGMAGMLNTVWLILSALVFGGIMEASGFLRRITELVIKNVRSVGQLFAATVGTCVFTNVTASDQYLAIIIPGQMYKEAYKDRGLAPENLSRSLEDAGTVTSVLVPWNTCGAFHAGVLGVTTFSYAPFAVFCYLSPIVTLVFAFWGIRLAKLSGR